MQGPNFLVFYGVAAGIVLVGAYFFITAQDMTGAQRPPPTPSVVDPYEIAYLRGGANEVIRTAVYALRQKGLIEFEKGRIRASGFTPGELVGVERPVYARISSTPKLAALFSGDMRETVERLCGAYRQRLAAQALLASPEIRRSGQLAVAIACVLLVALAAYKIWAATQHGHSNVGFLVAEAAIACFALFAVYRKTAGGIASKRGKAFLAQIQLAYAGRVAAVFGGDAGGAPGQAALGGAALLMVGLFGFGILKGTPDAALAQAFAQSSSSGGDGGGGCGGGGGGCGGCGGGD